MDYCVCMNYGQIKYLRPLRYRTEIVMDYRVLKLTRAQTPIGIMGSNSLTLLVTKLQKEGSGRVNAHFSVVSFFQAYQ